uniref:Ground-like domain-containing protein n=1 Tax=Steinernema glaseri TaxID=37863 RepID=A0A1I7ZPI6_9BILA
MTYLQPESEQAPEHLSKKQDPRFPEMVRLLSSVAILVFVPLVAEAIFFGNNNCCCGCPQPQPSNCGCQQQQPVCPPPQPCPPQPVCPPPPPPVTCPAPPPPPPCPPPPACPPPPVAICPAPQPVYVQNPCGSSGGCSSSYSSGTYSGAQSSGCRTRYVVIRAPTATYTGEVKPQLVNTVQSNIGQNEQLAEIQGASPGASEGYRKARGAPTLNEPKCNSKELKELIEQNIVPNNPVESKRKIHKSAISAIDTAIVDVICSESGFTYIVSTAEHCEAQKDGVICFAYKRP